MTTDRLLFQRPDGQPYEFWLQHDFPDTLKSSLTSQILDHGGKVLPGKFEFPDYGFLLIDPYSARTVYEIKTTYHKPVKNAGFVAFRRGAGATPTPLRHVLSYRFVDAVLTKGSWDHHDLLKWGWPVEMSPEEWQDKEAVARRYKRQVREGGVDEELEKGWMWPTSSIFNACEPGHDFTEELEQLNDLKQRERTKEKATAAKSRQQEKEMDAWIQGVVVTNTKLNLQTKFYLHNDIEEDEERKLVRLILKNGGVTCYDSLEADYILLSTPVEEIGDDPEIVQWIARRSRAVDCRLHAQVKFVGWVQAVVEAGGIADVGPEVEDAVVAYQKYRQERRKGKGKGKAKEVPPEPIPAKRKRVSEDADSYDVGSSPTKRRKIDQTINGSSTTKTQQPPPSSSHARLSTVSRLNRSSNEPGSGSTVKPSKTFKGSAPYIAPSPLSRNQKSNVSSLTLRPSSLRPSIANPPVDEEEEEEESQYFEAEEAIYIPPGSDSPTDHLDPLQVPVQRTGRLSALSGITSRTAESVTSSKVGNVTNTTSTSNAKSARSVGPNVAPSYAKQVGRMSTSTAARPSTSTAAGTGLETSGSGASRGVLEGSLQPHKPLSVASAAGRQEHPDPDDLAGEEILKTFGSPERQPARLDIGSPSTWTDTAVIRSMPLTAVEVELVHFWREIISFPDTDMVEGLVSVINSWSERREHLEREKNAKRRAKGKGRVSFPDQLEEEVEEVRVPKVEEEVSVPEKKPLTKFASRARQTSRTPSSLGQPSDDEQSQLEEIEVKGGVDLEDEVVPETDLENLPVELKRTPNEPKRTKPKRTQKDSSPLRAESARKTKESADGPDVFGPIKFPKLSTPAGARSASKPASTSSSRLKAPNPGSSEDQEKETHRPRALDSDIQTHAQGTVEEEAEAAEDIAPLPPAQPPRRKPRQKRAGSVISGAGSESESKREPMKLRRGRSASVQPPDIPKRATTKGNKAKMTGTEGGEKGRGKYAAKNAGVRPLKKK